MAKVYKGAFSSTLPITVSGTGTGVLASYKIFGNTGGVGFRTEQLFSAANSEGGYLDVDGNVVSPQHANLRHTDFLALPLAASDITVSYEGPSGTGMNAPALCFYDSAKTYLAGEPYDGARTKTFTVPENARYFRTSYRSTMTSVNIVAGTVPATSDIPYGYKLPITSNSITTDIYIGDTALAKDEYADSETGKIYRWADITGLSEPLCGIDEYADSLELSTGTLTRKIYKMRLTNPESITTIANGYRLAFSILSYPALKYTSDAGICNIAMWNRDYNKVGFVASEKIIYITQDIAEWATKEGATAWLDEHEVYVWYILAEPETSTVPVPSGLTGTIEGYLIQDGTPTPESPIYPTANGVKQEDGTYIIENAYIAPTDPPAPLPEIPTFAGTTIIDYAGEGLAPSQFDGVAGWGNLPVKKLNGVPYTGTLPAVLTGTKAGYLAGYKIWGNTGGVGNEAENLFDISTVEKGRLDNGEVGYASATTALSVSGGTISFTTSSNYRGVCCGFVEIPTGADSLTFSGMFIGEDGIGKKFVFYDPQKIWLNADVAISVAESTSTVTIPTSAKYVRLSFTGQRASNYTIKSLMLNLGSTALPYEPYGYKLPILSNATTTDIYIGDTQLAKDEYVDSEAGKIYRYVDGTLTPTDPPAPLPQIPTFAGETTIDYGATALPHAAGLDGIFEYGSIDGLTWKNSVSGENDITFDTAVTDTGAEYVLPAGATGQYTSKSGEYRTAFTWYCIAKCPTTCHAAGQYMISDLGNGIGVEISSGWGAYTSIGGNHLVRGVDNRDYNSQMPVTSYALIAVAGDVNGVASVYVNGVKMTDSWNFNPVSSSGAAAVFLGKRASGQLSGTDIDYKFLALGTTKQTDAEIIANSQYLMTKYLGVGRPEKVELDVHGGAGSGLAPSEFDSIQEWVDIPTYTRVNGKWVANFETIIYGFHVDPSISDPANAVTYLLDAVGKTPATNSSSVVDYSDWADAFFMPKPCMLNYDGTVAYYLDPNDYTKKADGSPSDVANPLFPGNAMMEWSVIWWKFEAGEVEGEMSFYVSNRQVDSTYHCWCNIDAENHITDHFYTAIYNGTSATTYSDSATYAVDDLVTYSSAEYKCTTAVETPEAFDSTKWEKVSDVTRLRSLSGKALTAANGNGNTTGTVEVQRATANNTTATVEWYTDVFSDRQLINGLLTLVSKTLDSSAVYGRGLDSGSRAAKEAYITGTLNDKGLFWGNPSAGTSAKKCFGMENWDGCVWHRTAGLIGSSSTGGYAYKLTYNTADGSTATSYNSTGSGYLVGATGDGTTIARPSDGYVKTMKVASATGIWLPGTVGGSTSTYYCDYYYGGSRYGLAGGRSSYGAHCGCWFLNLSTAFGTADWGVAASPSCKPLASRF